jgi:hypothetical protein
MLILRKESPKKRNVVKTPTLGNKTRPRIAALLIDNQLNYRAGIPLDVLDIGAIM